MNPKFKDKLQDVDSPEHGALLTYVKRLISISRTEMSKHYDKWDKNQAVFESLRAIDKEDRNADLRGSPKKMIVPLTFTQIMTFVSFNVMSITQNRRFFELEPTGREDQVLQEPMELLLERDTRRNKWNSFLVQFFLDIGRFSVGAAEVCYVEEMRYMMVEEEVTVQTPFGGQQTQKKSGYREIPIFVGNKVYPVSPYNFFPDTRLKSLTRYQDGEFCGSEDVFSYSRLLGDPALFNLDKIPKFAESDYKTRLKKSRSDIGVPDTRINPNLSGFGDSSDRSESQFVKSGDVIVTKIVFEIVPSKFKSLAGAATDCEPMGDETFPVRMIAWYANDKVVTRFESAYYLHGMYPYVAAQYLPDNCQTVNQGLAEVCDQITELITWKLNTHVASQKNSVESKFVVDPSGVDIRTLESRSPYIYLKKSAAQQDVRRYITQFTTVDTTANTMNDVEGLIQMLEKITGNSAQMQGQYSSGRRSATQDRVVAQGAGARGKTLLAAIWDTSFEPLGKQFIANNRQDMDIETFAMIMGNREWPTNPAAPPQQDPQTGAPVPVPYTIQDIFQMFKADPVTIARSEDFFVFDGTLPSEKAFLAQSLQEVFTTIITNPAVAQVLGFGQDALRELFNQIYLLRGVTPARLPVGGPPIVVPPDQNGGSNATPLREIVSIKLPDLSGNERAQALSRIGIKADAGAHDKRLALEQTKPAPKSNGSTS